MGRASIQIVMGPAGSGKSTYCHAMQQHAMTAQKRKIWVANLDPAAENEFAYDVLWDIRDLISVQDVMEELGLGPNGALIYCMEYLLENRSWLQEKLDELEDDEYLLLDCPGQIELYTHVPIMRHIVDLMRYSWGFESSMVGVFCVDATFLIEASKFLSGSLLALTAMIALELPHVNMLTKCDLMPEDDVEMMLSMQSATELWNRELYHYQERQQREIQQEQSPNGEGIGDDDHDNHQRSGLKSEDRSSLSRRGRPLPKRYQLTQAIASLLDDYTMVSFLPLNIQDEDSMQHVLMTVDHAIQYGENQEVQTEDFDEAPGGGGEDS